MSWSLWNTDKIWLKTRENGISLVIFSDFGQIDKICIRKKALIGISSSNNENLFFRICGLKICQKACPVRITFKGGNRLGSNNNISPLRERFPQWNKGILSHNDSMIQGCLFEILKIFRIMPRELVLASNYPIGSHGCDKCNLHQDPNKNKILISVYDFTPTFQSKEIFCWIWKSYRASFWWNPLFSSALLDFFFFVSALSTFPFCPHCLIEKNHSYDFTKP